MERIQKDINSSMRAILVDWLVEVEYNSFLLYFLCGLVYSKESLPSFHQGWFCFIETTSYVDGWGFSLDNKSLFSVSLDALICEVMVITILKLVLLTLIPTLGS